MEKKAESILKMPAAKAESDGTACVRVLERKKKGCENREEGNCMPCYWWVRQRLEETSGPGLSRRKTQKESFAPVEEDDDDGARESERQFLEGGGVEREGLRWGLDIRDYRAK